MIHVGDACQEMQAMLLKDGLMKFSILPRSVCSIPSSRFVAISSCYYACAEPVPLEQNRTEDCAPETVAERALTGTWVLDEILLAVQKGYVLVEVHEVYGLI